LRAHNGLKSDTAPGPKSAKPGFVIVSARVNLTAWLFPHFGREHFLRDLPYAASVFRQGILAQPEYDDVSTITALEIPQNLPSPETQLARAHASYNPHSYFSILLRALPQTGDVKNNEQ